MSTSVAPGASKRTWTRSSTRNAGVSSIVSVPPCGPVRAVSFSAGSAARAGAARATPTATARRSTATARVAPVRIVRSVCMIFLSGGVSRRCAEPLMRCSRGTNAGVVGWARPGRLAATSPTRTVDHERHRRSRQLGQQGRWARPELSVRATLRPSCQDGAVRRGQCLDGRSPGEKRGEARGLIGPGRQLSVPAFLRLGTMRVDRHPSLDDRLALRAAAATWGGGRSSTTSVSLRSSTVTSWTNHPGRSRTSSPTM